jgi:tRNA1Val (adenine37-N6)-methyltransferase
MADIFRFKQFSIDQTGCAMKVNTDGVLLGALVVVSNPNHILDIGTGTGVIAMMLAQRFIYAHIKAVELDDTAAVTANNNFQASQFSERLELYAQSFQEYFHLHPDERFDLIVSNPPFYLQSLHSSGAQKVMAKHTDALLFEQLVSGAAKHLHPDGLLWLILPPAASMLVKKLANESNFFLQRCISIGSYPQSVPHREILAFGLQFTSTVNQHVTIYNEPKVYSARYQELLKNFLTIF